MIVLWLLGLVTSYTMGGLIHVLLVIAIIVLLLAALVAIYGRGKAHPRAADSGTSVVA